MTRVVLLNGPPSSGKDTAAQLLRNALKHTHHRQFKRVLYAAVCYHYHVLDEDWKRLYRSKDQPSEELGGLTPRQALIHVAENLIKPNYGSDYVARRALKDIDPSKVSVFSDCGFSEEVVASCETVGCDNVLLIRLWRDDTSFEEDVRDYLYPDYCQTIDVENNGSADELCMTLLSVIIPWLHPEKPTSPRSHT